MRNRYLIPFLFIATCLHELARLKAASSMAPKAKSRAKARAAAKRLRNEQLQRANARQKLRRQALQELNKLTVEMGLAARPLILNSDAGSLVEKLVRLCT